MVARTFSLDQYWDPKLRVDPEDTPHSITDIERERLTREIRVLELLTEIPRRLGPDADGSELANDKRKARRVQFALAQVLRAWGGPTRPPAKVDAKVVAAKLNWKLYWEEKQSYVKGRMVYIVTWARKTEYDEVYPRKAVNKLINELRWVEYALR